MIKSPVGRTIAGFVLAAALLVGCSSEGSSPQRASSGGGGVGGGAGAIDPQPAGGNEQPSSTTTPAVSSTFLANPNVDVWFTPKGFDTAQMSDGEKQCARNYLNAHSEVANSIDTSRVEHAAFTRNYWTVLLECLPKEKVGSGFIDQVSKKAKQTFTPEAKACVVQVFTSFSNQDILNFDQTAVYQRFLTQVQKDCPDASNPSSATKTN